MMQWPTVTVTTIFRCHGFVPVYVICLMGLFQAWSAETAVPYEMSYMQDSCTCTAITHLRCQPYTQPHADAGAGLVGLSRSERFHKEFYCQYTIEAPPGSRVLVRLNHIRIPLSRGCKNAMLKIYDGAPGPDETPLAGLCGNNVPAFSYRSTTNLVTLTYHQSHAILRRDKSFNLTFTYFRFGQLNHATCNRTQEFPCYNGICITRDLECDGYDNCGDGTDESMDYHVCGKMMASSDPVVGLAVGVTVVCVMLVGVLGGVAYGLKKKKSAALRGYSEETALAVIREHLRRSVGGEESESPCQAETAGGAVAETSLGGATSAAAHPVASVLRLSGLSQASTELYQNAPPGFDTLPPSYSTLFPDKV